MSENVCVVDLQASWRAVRRWRHQWQWSRTQPRLARKHVGGC